MSQTPKGLRLHIALFGRRNTGKSSLCNALAGQQVSIVSATPGTTTDPVEKTLELPPLGPVVLLDTAGMDDEGPLGQLRIARSMHLMERIDMALLVTEQTMWGQHEAHIAALLREKHIPFVVVRNKMDAHRAERAQSDAAPSAQDIPGHCDDTVPVIDVSAKTGFGLDAVRTTLARLSPEHALRQPPLLADLLPAHGLVVLVAPIDTGAPKGRLILPQVQAIRDSLDNHRLCLMVTEEELLLALARLKCAPDLVVCDSQVVQRVAADTPADIPVTTFSILMARLKGDLAAFARGAAALARLEPGDAVCIQEACSHHPQEDDIARVKLPRLLRKLAGGELTITVEAGKEFPSYPASCKAVVHCGGCVITRGNMLARLHAAAEAHVPMTNYGMAISLAQGVLERVLSPFPQALCAYADAMAAR